ncbi:MAG TPA: 50S ribosomal protein L22 [Candidatus Moranbacteria bacterium]|nr:MAG: 50S ribosomal protein L22 [Candidatus Moranbacteria bacterium GW2011_GWC2_45_10]KKT95311.1 MAG: 50S ribosomal protein L22 [Parcubacteria group bacterium GW2011_GWC1_45_14]HAV11001.1 50S ribosomal protein L22 [Candidatus Moranbacteria bacterium]
MKVEATLKNLRVSPRKVRLVINLIKGMDVANALVQLSLAVKGSSREIEKLLKSAIANAENNFGLDRDNLMVADIQVGGGPTLKRWLPRAHGRATPLMKRTSNVYLVLDEKIEGMKKKAKAKKIEKKAVETEEVKTESESKESKKAVVAKSAPAKNSPAGGLKGQKGAFAKKSFQRKSV